MEDLGWKTIEELITIESVMMVYKSLNGLAPQSLPGANSSSWTMAVHRRSCNLLLIIYVTPPTLRDATRNPMLS